MYKEFIRQQHRHLHAFKSTQKQPELLKQEVGLKIFLKRANKENLPSSYPLSKLSHGMGGVI
jgi:hypothetical protein